MAVHRLPTKDAPSSAPVEVAAQTRIPLDIEGRQLLVDSVHAQFDGVRPVASLGALGDASRWRLMLEASPHAAPGPVPFDYERLVRRAALRMPEDRSPTVSGFASWIYALYGIERDLGRMRRGVDDEAIVFKARAPISTAPGWDLIHNGMQIDSSPMRSSGLPGAVLAASRKFTISALCVGGRALAASPDLVFRERPNSIDGRPTGAERIVIVEIKSSSAPIPPDMWPNVRAQLWAYSKIDDFVDADEVFLVAEVWRSSGMSCGLRRSLTWTRRSETLNQECSQLFELYSGQLRKGTARGG